MDNLEIWQKVAQPPPDALKEIKGGRMSGKTDISPQWRMKAMTELFGPCGIGWKWAIDKLWTEPGPGGEVMAFALVNVWITGNGAWSDPIPGIGGNALIAKESGGLRSNDEAYKMAVTDALSVAFKSLGVAADIYAGKWDGTKYKDAPEAPKLPGPAKLSDRAVRPPDAPPLTLTGEDDPLLTDSQRKKLFALVNEHAVPTEDMRAYCAEKFQVNSRAELRMSHLPSLVLWVKAHKKAEVA
jgi:hypothetical protein